MTEFLGRLLGYDDVSRIDEIDPDFGAGWAHAFPALVWLGGLALIAIAVVFYVKAQTRGRLGGRIFLGAIRGTVLFLLLLILADPILRIRMTSRPKPTLWLVFDGTESMQIDDEYPAETTSKLRAATGLANDKRPPTRLEYLKAYLSRDAGKPLEKLADQYTLKAFLFEDRQSVRELSMTPGDDETLVDHLAEQLSAPGEVTAMGNAFDELARREATGTLKGVLVFSDFAWNSGVNPIAAAKRLGQPVHTVGIGAESARDLSVRLDAPLKMKKGEATSIWAHLEQNSLTGEDTLVRVYARKVDETTGKLGEPKKVGEHKITLAAGENKKEFSHTPEESGRFMFYAEVGRDTGGEKLAPLTGEVVAENNIAERETAVIDDYMRLLFVEDEPTWEWRFIKEVFHRDKLVGMEGFRTYLRAADINVKRSNPLFKPQLTMTRKEFFQHDVIFLGDMPNSSLSESLGKMTKEFVAKFGGGLVVIAGPRFGPRELAGTEFADMLPVVIDPDATIRDSGEFPLNLTPAARRFDFMGLGTAEGSPTEREAENTEAWENLKKIPWYTPVKRVEPTSTVLAVHPFDKCADGKTPQPLIAIRRYGRGEVVYIAFNEMWRLRKEYGEKYYRRFWGQLIHRLGLSHALGAQKRFTVRTDRQSYRADEKAVVTIEAYDDEYQPLIAAKVDGGSLKAQIIKPNTARGEKVEEIRISELRPGVFEARVPVFFGGEYRVRVFDPITKKYSEPIHFQVTRENVERRDPKRNVDLQSRIAAETEGTAYDLTTVDAFLNIVPAKLVERSEEQITLWNTWLTFLLVAVLLLLEWALRKSMNLP